MKEQSTAAQIYQMGKNYFQIRNYDKAKEYLIQAVMKGSSGAASLLYRLGREYMARKTEKDYRKSEECFQVLADRGDSRACLALGELCEEGLGREVDIESAFSYYAEAYRMGEAMGAYRAGTLLIPGGAHSEDIRKTAEEWLLEAADAGIGKAYTKLGWLYREDKPVNSDDNRRALSWFLKGVDAGDPEAMRAAGDFFFDGVAVGRDRKMGLYLFEKAASMGDARAELRLGDLYSDGNGVKRNVDKALEYYAKASEKGDEDARYCGSMLAYQEGRAVMDPKNGRISRKKGERYLKLAIEMGCSPAYNELGLLYCTAPSGSSYRKIDEALACFQKGKKAGDKEYAGANYIQLCMNEGRKYFEKALRVNQQFGRNFSENPKKRDEYCRLLEETLAFWKKAAAAGSAEGWSSVAHMYFYRGEFLDPVPTEKDFLAAAKKGIHDEEGQALELLYHYYSEPDLWNKEKFHREDPEKAFQMAMKLAKLGYPYYMEILSRYYKKGYGTTKDEGRSRMWAVRARDR